MLAALSIRDIVLIDRLDLEFGDGLSVLTGETGAGKSILLDALSLALGARGDAGLVRAGCTQGQVTAVFDLAPGHAALDRLSDQDIGTDGPIVLRRVQSADGRSRAYVNDQPVSVQLLRDLGHMLVEIHGQHDERALIDPDSHRALLDAFGDYRHLLDETAGRYSRWQDLAREARAATKALAAAQADQDYLVHAVDELDALEPRPGEESELAATRQAMMAAEKLAGDLNEALAAVSGEGAADMQIAAMFRRLDRRRDEAPELIGPVADGLDKALAALDEARLQIEAAIGDAAYDPAELDRTEERLFALRAAARKHNVAVDNLADFADRLRADLSGLEAGEAALADLEAQSEAARSAFLDVAATLTARRAEAAEHLSAAINTELRPLKLDGARFSVEIETDAAERGGAHGLDRVAFWVQTNPGSRPGPILKVASGGELSRILLALKVALADKGSAPTLIFDEIDTAVGGAVSDAIGQRLARLAGGVQVLSVTHAPQVAARADNHFQIAKAPHSAEDRVRTEVQVLAPKDRREEIARMLAGATITDEARAAADRLMALAG